jgi:hypothetical protein
MSAIHRFGFMKTEGPFGNDSVRLMLLSKKLD